MNKMEMIFCIIFSSVGVILVLAFGIVAFYLPPPTDLAILDNLLDSLQVILAISVAAAAALLPGFLTIEIKQKLGKRGLFALRAGGALAVFVIVFALDPSFLTKSKVASRVSYIENLADCENGTEWISPEILEPSQDALLACKQAQNLDPNRYEAYRYEGRYHFILRDYAQMRDVYEKALLVFTKSDDLNRSLEYSPNDLEFQKFGTLLRGYAFAILGHLGETWPMVDTKAENLIDAMIKYRNRLDDNEKSSVDEKLKGEMADLTSMINLHQLLITKNTDNDRWKKSIDQWRSNIKIGRSPLMWTHYHLACACAGLLSVADEQEEKDRSAHCISKHIGLALDQAIIEKDYLERSKELMRCIFRRDERCKKRHPGQPMDCYPLIEFASNNAEIANSIDDFIS